MVPHIVRFIHIYIMQTGEVKTRLKDFYKTEVDLTGGSGYDTFEIRLPILPQIAGFK